MTIRFTSVVGGDTGLLNAALEHYRSLGVESFHITRHIESLDDPDFQRDQNVLARHGLAFAAVHQGPWDEDLNANLIWAQMRRNPSDWWVVADLDEFHVYDRPLADIVTACEVGGYDHVMGAMLDRVAADGSLPALQPTASIWAQYPLAGLVTLRLLRAGIAKVTLARGEVHLRFGQHSVYRGRPLPVEEAFAQVHHFKWTESVLPALTRRAQAYSSGDWYTIQLEIVEESRRILRYLEANGGRINVTAADLALQQCGSDYMDYKPWADLVSMLMSRSGPPDRRIAELEKENRELSHANEVLKAALAAKDGLSLNYR